MEKYARLHLARCWRRSAKRRCADIRFGTAPTRRAVLRCKLQKISGRLRRQAPRRQYRIYFYALARRTVDISSSARQARLNNIRRWLPAPTMPPAASVAIFTARPTPRRRRARRLTLTYFSRHGTPDFFLWSFRQQGQQAKQASSIFPHITRDISLGHA